MRLLYSVKFKTKALTFVAIRGGFSVEDTSLNSQGSPSFFLIFFLEIFESFLVVLSVFFGKVDVLLFLSIEINGLFRILDI
jgi:hypothetical protein